MTKSLLLLLSTLIISFFTGCTLQPKPEKNFSLEILHLDDTHSHITSERMKFKVAGKKVYFEVGGYPRIITKVDELISKNPNHLILNAGDVFQGTLYYSLFRGEADAKMLNLIPWDAYELGNHEFDDGDEALSNFLDKLNPTIAVLGANIVVQGNDPLKGKIKPYIIKDINGQKVAVIGIDEVYKTINSSNPGKDLKFLDELTTAQRYIDKLSNEGIDKIILLTHQGYENDIKMAQNLKGVDAIIGGDSHTLLGNFKALGLKSISDSYPTVTTSKDGKKVCIAHAWEYGHILGDLKVTFDAKGDVLSCGGNPLLLIGDTFLVKNKKGKKVPVSNETKTKILVLVNKSSNIAITKEDTKALNIIKKFKKEVDKKKSIVIGKALEDLGHNRIPGDKKDGKHILPLGSDIAPIVAKAFYDLSKTSDAAIQNAGGVRIAINKGDITMGEAYRLLPFANTLYQIKMSGSEVKQVLEDAIANIKKGGSTGSFPYAYALRYDVDMSQPIGNTISNLEIKDRKTGKWSKIDPNKIYIIVTNSYTAGGKDGYVTFKTAQEKRGKGVDTYLDYAMSFIRYVQKNKNIKKLPREDHPIKSFKK